MVAQRGTSQLNYLNYAMRLATVKSQWGLGSFFECQRNRPRRGGPHLEGVT